MIELSQLWLPILLSALAVFFISFLMWMVLPHHRGDWKGLPDEDKVMGVLRDMGVNAGQYGIPDCSNPAQMKDPVWMAKYNKGPKGFLILWPEGPLNMGKNLVTSFVFNLLTALAVAYVAHLALDVLSTGMEVLHLVGAVAVMANSFALVWGAIWFGRTWSSTLREIGDGVVYGLATGLIFMALWPGV